MKITRDGIQFNNGLTLGLKGTLQESHGLEVARCDSFDLSGHVTDEQWKAVAMLLDSGRNRLEIDHPGLDQDVSIRRSGEKVLIETSSSVHQTSITFNPERLQVNSSSTWQSYLVTESGDKVTIQPSDFTQKTYINKMGNKITIDPPGITNSVLVTTGEDGVSINPSGYNDQIKYKIS